MYDNCFFIVTIVDACATGPFGMALQRAQEPARELGQHRDCDPPARSDRHGAVSDLGVKYLPRIFYCRS